MLNVLAQVFDHQRSTKSHILGRPACLPVDQRYELVPYFNLREGSACTLQERVKYLQGAASPRRQYYRFAVVPLLRGTTNCHHRQTRDCSAQEVLSNNKTLLRGGWEDRHIREWEYGRTESMILTSRKIKTWIKRYPYLRRLDR